MTTEIGDAEDKYRNKIRDTDDLDVDWMDLYDFARNKPVRKRIKIKKNPEISYGVDSEDEGYQDENILFGIKKHEIISEMNKWKLNFTKPGRKKGSKMEFLISDYGSQENQEKTLASMLERQIANKEKFHIDIKEQDVKYDIVIDKPLPDRSAYFIIMRDVSGSMDKISKFAYSVALRITLWLQHLYRENVTRVYIVHSIDAMEVSEEEMFGINGRETPIESGGTAFLNAYNTVNSMLKGTQYKSSIGVSRHINSENEDVYLLHITDGENADPNKPVIDVIKSILPELTRFMYLEIGSGGGAANSFMSSLSAVKEPNVKMVAASDNESTDNIRDTITKLLND